MTVAPASCAAASACWAWPTVSVAAITSATAPCRVPPSEVKSFWNSIRTRAVVFGSIGAPSSYRWPGPCARAAISVMSSRGSPRCASTHACLLCEQFQDVPVRLAGRPGESELTGAVAAGVCLGVQLGGLGRLPPGRRSGQLRVQHAAVTGEGAAAPVEWACSPVSATARDTFTRSALRPIWVEEQVGWIVSDSSLRVLAEHRQHVAGDEGDASRSPRRAGRGRSRACAGNPRCSWTRRRPPAAGRCRVASLITGSTFSRIAA